MSLLLVAYLATLALHAAFVAYVLAGSAYALVQAVRRADDPLAAQVRDRLPFMLGCGITAGVAPLLFLQLLYQRRFYTANLLLGPRWIAIVPALIAGFYGLYLAKASARWRKLALAVSVACFAFVAYSWSEQHALMQDSAVWQAMYAAGNRIYFAGEVPLRFALFAGAMATLFAMIAAWGIRPHRSSPALTAAGEPLRRRLAVIALGGRAVAIGAALGLAASGAAAAQPSPWLYALAAAVAVDCIAWVAVVRRPDSSRALLVATLGGVAALAAAVVVRELPRLALIEPPGPLSAGAGASWLFAASLLVGGAAIAWILRTVRRAPPEP